jgi:predicted methyltransferase
MVRAWVLALVVIACGTPARTDEARPGSVDDGSYEGRPIAGTCSYLGADWLERPERDAREQPEKVLDLLGIAPGMTVADVGAGSGYFTRRLARRVGPTGRVLATDLQPEMLRMLDARLVREHVSNVQLILATPHQARLPERCCDLVLLVDVYHELSDPAGVIAGIRRALRAHGRLVLIASRGEDPKVPIKAEHKMTLARIEQELEPLGFAFVSSLEDLPDQRIVVFTRDDAPPP